jgi:hypothetical protein
MYFRPFVGQARASNAVLVNLSRSVFDMLAISTPPCATAAGQKHSKTTCFLARLLSWFGAPVVF